MTRQRARTSRNASPSIGSLGTGQALPMCSDLYLTLVKREVEGDAVFPPFEDCFELVETLQDNADFKILHYQKRTS